MLKCPWCGAQMGPVQKGKNQWELPGYRKVPLGRRKFGFAFRCRNRQCDFSTEDLPLFVVDESIYEETPTLLLGTVDKFAMLPFRPNAQKIFGYENGVKKIVMVSAQTDKPEEVESLPLNQDTVFLKAECNFTDRKDMADFYYSLDGKKWIKIGSQLKMAYTLPHFMGYRFGLFNYATKTSGGVCRL